MSAERGLAEGLMEVLRDWQWEKRGRQKFAMALTRIRSGAWAHRRERFWTFELTTKAGTDNTWKTMVKHFRALVKVLREKGYRFEYVVCPELSPGRGLLHLHGLACGGNRLAQSELSELWQRIHGARVVWIRAVWGMEGLQSYVAKHQAKWYPAASEFRGRLLMSKGWMPESWMAVRKVFIKWASGDAAEVYRHGAWERMNELWEEWCKGGVIRLVVGSESIRLEGPEIARSAAWDDEKKGSGLVVVPSGANDKGGLATGRIGGKNH